VKFKRRILAALLLPGLLSACSMLVSDRNSKNKHEVAELNAQLGSQYMIQGNLDMAEKKFLKALEFQPKLHPAHIGLALVYERQGQAMRAEQSYQTALKLAPKDPDTLNNYGTFLCRAGKLTQAETYFSAAAEAHGNMHPGRAYENAGICYLREPDYPKAEHYLRLALEKSPELPQALFSMASISMKTEKYIQARGYLREYHRLHGQSAQSLQLAMEIEQKFGVKDQAEFFKSQLMQKFPDSEQARTLRAIQAVGG
jgi:type IV pilus assembly protein PilF